MLRAMGDLAATDRRVTIKRTVAQAVDLLQAARDAAGRPAWRQAYEAYARVGREDLTPADLEQFAGAAWWNGKLDEAIDLRERAHAAYLSAGDAIRAARVALTLSHDHVGRGAFAVSHGWFAKAERLLSAEPESVEHARLTLTRGINGIFGGGDLREATAELDRAFELAARFGDRDTQALALVAKGRALVKMGEVEQGLALIDEATAAALGGELDPYSTGLVYCVTISSCQDLGDYRRAAEWTEQANRWCDRLDVTGFPGACRIHRAEIMRLRGDWGEAEQQALTACEELHDFERAITAGGGRPRSTPQCTWSRAGFSSLKETTSAPPAACSVRGTSGSGSARRTRRPRRGCSWASPSGDRATSTLRPPSSRLPCRRSTGSARGSTRSA